MSNAHFHAIRSIVGQTILQHNQSQFARLEEACSSSYHSHFWKGLSFLLVICYFDIAYWVVRYCHERKKIGNYALFFFSFFKPSSSDCLWKRVGYWAIFNLTRPRGPPEVVRSKGITSNSASPRFTFCFQFCDSELGRASELRFVFTSSVCHSPAYSAGFPDHEAGLSRVNTNAIITFP